MIRGAAVVVLMVAACNGGSAAPLPASSGSAGSGSAAKARAIAAGESGESAYRKLCAPCHGAGGEGYVADHAPSLKSTTFLESATDGYLRRSIGVGRPGTSMAGYAKEVGGPLDAGTMDRLVAYIRAWGPPAHALPSAGTGDATRGALIYATTCQRCHGEPKLRGEAVHLANPRFLEVASDAFIRYAIVHGRPATPMIAWAGPGPGQLTDSQVDDVVAAVRAFGTPAVAPAVTLLPAPTGKEPLVINPAGKAPSFTLKDDRYVPTAQVADALAQHRKMIILDARSPSDWMRVHITGAISAPYHDLTKLDAIPNDGTWVIAYCACPHHLSGIVVDELRKRGYPHTAVLDEGILDWHRRGFPVVAAPGVTPPPAEMPSHAP